MSSRHFDVVAPQIVRLDLVRLRELLSLLAIDPEQVTRADREDASRLREMLLYRVADYDNAKRECVAHRTVRS